MEEWVAFHSRKRYTGAIQNGLAGCQPGTAVALEATERESLTLDYTPGCSFMQRRSGDANWRCCQEARCHPGCDSPLRAQCLTPPSPADRGRLPPIARKRCGDTANSSSASRSWGLRSRRSAKSSRCGTPDCNLAPRCAADRKKTLAAWVPASSCRSAETRGGSQRKGLPLKFRRLS